MNTISISQWVAAAVNTLVVVGNFVAQVSQPAVSPISKSARRDKPDGTRVLKPAIQQTWKSALPLAAAVAMLFIGTINTFAQVSRTVGTLPPGGTVTITFDVIINTNFPLNTFSVTNQGNLTGTGINILTDDPTVGGANDPTVTLLPADLDFGDAPLPYPTVLTNGGASHVIPFTGPTLCLGSVKPDIETNGQPNVSATGDGIIPNSTTLTATFLTNSAGTFIPVANLARLVGLPITFNNAVRGTLSGAQTTIQASGTATATFTANAAGAGSADAVVDNQTTTASITIPTGVSSINRVQTTPTNLASVQWTVTFTNAVSGVVAGNFSLANVGLGGSPAISSVTAVGGAPATSWTVTASTGSGTGTLGLNMANGTGVSAVIVNLPFTGQVYTIDLVPPDTSITAQPPSLTNSASASFSFTGTDTGVGVASFQCRLDGAGNTDASPATVTWTVDTIPPTVNCSTDIVVTANGYCPVAVNYAVSVSDNVAISTATTNPPSGSVFAVGTNTVTLGARDTAGNTNFCTFKVIVLSGTAPQLTIARAGTNAILSWPDGFTCYALQFTPALLAPPAVNTWTVLPGPYLRSGGNFFATNGLSTTNFFFRLAY